MSNVIKFVIENWDTFSALIGLIAAVIWGKKQQNVAREMAHTIEMHGLSTAKKSMRTKEKRFGRLDRWALKQIVKHAERRMK